MNSYPHEYHHSVYPYSNCVTVNVSAQLFDTPRSDASPLPDAAVLGATFLWFPLAGNSSNPGE